MDSTAEGATKKLYQMEQAFEDCQSEISLYNKSREFGYVLMLEVHRPSHWRRAAKTMCCPTDLFSEEGHHARDSEALATIWDNAELRACSAVSIKHCHSIFLSPVHSEIIFILHK